MWTVTYLKSHCKVENGAKVCISRVKGVFDKGYMPNWSREQFTVSSLNKGADKTSVTRDRCTHSRRIETRNFAVNGTRKRFSRSVTTTTKSSGYLNEEQRQMAPDNYSTSGKIILQNIIRGLVSKT